MKDFEKKYIDLDYISQRDKLIIYLLDEDLYFSLSDAKKIRNFIKILLRILERGKK